MSDSYLAMVRGTRELHLLIAEGKDDSPEAEALRDATDGPWEALTETERTRARLLSEDLFSLHEAPPTPQQMTVEAQRALFEVKELQHAGEWDRALDLIRTWRAYIAPFLVSYLRGSIWYEAGDFATAALFFKHAYDLKPDNGVLSGDVSRLPEPRK
jgi:hypothetical protein